MGFWKSVLSFAAIVFLGATASRAGTLSVSTFTDDADSGISTSKTYTHLVDFNSDDGGATVNGVLFPVDTAPVGTGTLVGPASTFQNFNSPAPDTSGIEDLL